MRTLVGIAAAVLVMLPAGCSSSTEPADQAPDSNVAADSDTTSSADDVLGIWGADPDKAAESNRAWLNFAAGGELKGFDGCNAITGTWESSASGETINTDARRQSYVACPGVPTASFNELKLSGNSLTYTLTDAAGATSQAQLAKRDGTATPAA